MTKYYNIIKREDSSRIGILKLEKKYETPLLIDDKLYKKLFFDFGTCWLKNNKKKIVIKDKIKNNYSIIILPRYQTSLSYPFLENFYKQKIIYKNIFKINKSIENPIAIVYRPDTEKKNIFENDEERINSIFKKESHSILLKNINKYIVDIYILEGIRSLENDIYKFINLIINAKKSIPFDSALFLPNIATPINICLLIYLGCDIFDTTRITYDSLNDIYYTNGGFFNINELNSLTCSCNICKKFSIDDFRCNDEKKRFKLLYKHNINILKSELSIIKENIKKNNLRNYVESKCKLNTWLYGILQLYDRSKYYKLNTSIYKKNILISTSSESLLRSEIYLFENRIQNRYNSINKKILLLLPCSAKKPYSLSKSHIKINHGINEYKSYVHELILTSPIGLVPRELEMIYPPSSYDTTVTGFWDKNEIFFISSLLINFIKRFNYKYIIAHLPQNYRKILEIIKKNYFDIEIYYTCISNPSSKESIEKLSNTIKLVLNNENIVTKNYNQKLEILKAIALYQFGSISKSLFDDSVIIKGKYLNYKIYSKKNLLVSMDSNNGMLLLTIDAAIKLINDQNYNGQYTVFIHKFNPIGSIFSPGIKSASSLIRPGDEVIIRGDNIIGVGKAIMSGYEMCNSSKGLSIIIRHIKKIK